MSGPGFFILAVVMLISPWVIVRNCEKASGVAIRFLLVIILWLLYVILMVNSGVLTTQKPPLLPLLIVVPAILIGYFTTKWKPFNRGIHETPKAYPIFIQSFRVLVEVFIFLAAWEEILPLSVTFEGTNMDIFVGLSAPVIGVLYLTKGISRKLILLWNFLGLAVLSVTAGSFIYWFAFKLPADNLSSLEFLGFPYILLPAVLLPMAVFYHIVSIRQNWSQENHS